MIPVSLLLLVASVSGFEDGSTQKEKDLTQLRSLVLGRQATGEDRGRCTELGGTCGEESSGPPCCSDTHCANRGFCVKLCFNHKQLCNDEDLPDQCRTYNTLTDTNRLTARMHLDTGSVDEEPTRRGGDEKISDHSGDPNKSEEWQGEGWYRFKEGEPGIRMAVTREENVSKMNCGATHGAYMMKPDNGIPDGFGENRDSKVKFGSDIKDMKVTNCGTFFVYHLPDAPLDYGYCFVRVTMKDFEENVEVYEKL